MYKRVVLLHYILNQMQAIDDQCAQQIKSLEEELAEKAEELKETYQKVRYNLECNDFVNAVG